VNFSYFYFLKNQVFLAKEKRNVAYAICLPQANLLFFRDFIEERTCQGGKNCQDEGKIPFAVIRERLPG
jgi:hypothetical protein